MCSFPVPVLWHHFSLGLLSSSVASFPSPTCVQARPSSSRAMSGAVQVQGAESERAGVVAQTPACTSVPRENQQRGVRARPQVLSDALHTLSPGQRAGGASPDLPQPRRASGNEAGIKLPSCSPGWSVGCPNCPSVGLTRVRWVSLSLQQHSPPGRAQLDLGLG